MDCAAPSRIPIGYRSTLSISVPGTPFIARVPDEPGALHRVAELLGAHAVNINRIQYDHRIDRHIVFFEVSGPADGYARVIAGSRRWATCRRVFPRSGS